MFQVKLKADKEKITTVFSIRTDMLERVMFLVFINNNWVWVFADKWEPLKVEEV